MEPILVAIEEHVVDVPDYGKRAGKFMRFESGHWICIEIDGRTLNDLRKLYPKRGISFAGKHSLEETAQDFLGQLGKKKAQLTVHRQNSKEIESLTVEIKYLDIDGNEIDHEPIIAAAGFLMPQREEWKLINNEMWRVDRSEVVYYANPNRPGHTLINVYCEKEPS